jgi:hypothetical protein
MIVAIVSFTLPQPVTLAEMREVFRSRAPKYLKVSGLLRKNYFVAEDGRRAGGIYVWESKARAQEFFSPDWQRMVTGNFGVAPEILYLDSPVMVDNTAEKIVVD